MVVYEVEQMVAHTRRLSMVVRPGPHALSNAPTMSKAVPKVSFPLSKGLCHVVNKWISRSY